jgi:hypothetical protein
VLWRYRSLRRADRSSRGTLPRVLCLTVCDRETSKRSREHSWAAGPSERGREREREREREGGRERGREREGEIVLWNTR